MEEKKSNGLGIASLVLGIVSIVFSFIGLSTIGLIIGIVGIVLGVMARKKNPTGMAKAGLICSIIGTVLCALMFIACVGALGTASSLMY